MHLGRVITSPRCTVGRVNPSSSAFYQSKGRVDGSLDEPMLLSEGKLISNAVIDYLSYTTKVYQLTQRYENVSVYLYDREYRKLQASHGFRWGTDIPHLHVTQLVPRTPRNDRKLKSLNMSGPQPRPMNIPTGPRTLDGRAICKLYNSPRGCGYVDCKFVHACSHKGCNEVHSATVHFLTK